MYYFLKQTAIDARAAQKEKRPMRIAHPRNPCEVV